MDTWQTNKPMLGRNKMRLIKTCVVVLFSCILLSCSLVKTAYSNAPELAVWWLDEYFNLTQSQKLTLKPAIQNLHNWHRQNQLPIYLTFLRDMQTSLESEQFSASDTCEKIEAIKSSLHTLQIESIPIIIEIAPLLSEKQLNYFQQKLLKRAEKLKKQWLQDTPKEQLKVRLEKAQDFAEKIYGDLSEAQLALLKQNLAQIIINPAISYKEIQRRNDDAFNILSALQNPSLNPNEKSIDEKSQLVIAGFDRIQKSPNPIYQHYADEQTKHTCETIANLHATTNAKQKLHAKNWLGDYIVQLTALLAK